MNSSTRNISTPDTSTHLSVRINVPLDRFDLSVDFQTTHRVTGVFGVSGSGKTTLLETIAGLRRGANGIITLDDAIWLDSARKQWLPPERRDIGYVPQDSLLFPHLDVRANILSGSGRAKKNGVDLDATLDTVTRVLDIGTLLDRSPRTLSGGERQRVALGRALCSGPKLLLLDEPLASLDAGLRRKVLPFLHRVQREFALPMLLVSHNPVEVQVLCEDLIVLREGKIIARGEPRAVLTQPEIFPLAEQEGFENMLSGCVVETRDQTSIVRLGTGDEGPLLTVPRSGMQVGGRLLLSVPANDITLALERPRLLSARNIIQARIEQIQTVGTVRLITVRLADDVPPIVAEVTADAVTELHGAPGTEIFLIIKTSAITLYEDG
ncbi:MAG: molybdenum ABC transporter ATP-binding protein [Candidatus Kapaibacterium sp.]